MRKVSNKLLTVIGISSGVLALFLGLLVVFHYQPQNVVVAKNVVAPSDPFVITEPLNPKLAQVALEIPPTEVPETGSKKILALRPQPTPTPTIPWMEFSGVSILNLPTLMTFQPGCDDKAIALPEFQILPWTPDIFEKGEFDVSKKTAVAWEHLGYTGLWIHSGMDWAGNPLAAQPLQEYLEKKDAWRKNTPAEFDQKASECLIGSIVKVKVGEDLLEGEVTAVVRIPAGDVEMVSTHVMDLVPYLAQTYPDRGFEKLKAPELLLYFCGRLLSGEKPDYSIEDYSRTRIIVAIELADPDSIPNE